MERRFLTNFFSYFMFYDFAHCIDPHTCLQWVNLKIKKVQKYWQYLWKWKILTNFIYFSFQCFWSAELWKIIKISQNLSIWRSRNFVNNFCTFSEAKWPTVHTCSAFIRGGLLLECLSQSCFLVSTSRSWIFFCLEAIDKWIDEFWWI